MINYSQSKNGTDAAKGRLPGMKMGCPSVAGNLPHGMEHKFEAAPLSEAEFLRLPPAGKFCRYTGLSRSALVTTAKAAEAFISVRQQGRVRGVVLIDKERLTAFLRASAGAGDTAKREVCHE